MPGSDAQVHVRKRKNAMTSNGEVTVTDSGTRLCVFL